MPAPRPLQTVLGGAPGAMSRSPRREFVVVAELIGLKYAPGVAGYKNHSGSLDTARNLHVHGYAVNLPDFEKLSASGAHCVRVYAPQTPEFHKSVSTNPNRFIVPVPRVSRGIAGIA